MTLTVGQTQRSLVQESRGIGSASCVLLPVVNPHVTPATHQPFDVVPVFLLLNIFRNLPFVRTIPKWPAVVVLAVYKLCQQHGVSFLYIYILMYIYMAFLYLQCISFTGTFQLNFLQCSVLMLAKLRAFILTLYRRLNSYRSWKWGPMSKIPNYPNFKY